MTSTPVRSGPFTGRHMAAIMIGFFAVVIAVNLLMARLAGSTFGGVVVENSYVASQHFNGWLAAAERERGLGWKAEAVRRSDGRISVALIGAPADAVLVATARHPLGRMPDRRLAFTRQADGRFISAEVLPAARWRLRIEAQGGGMIWRREEDLR